MKGLAFLGLFFSSLAVFAGDFPDLKVTEIIGEASAESFGGLNRPLKVGMKVDSSLRLKTGEGSEVVFSFNGNSAFHLLSRSQLRLIWPEEKSQIVVLDLDHGLLRWRVPEDGYRNFKISSLLYEEASPVPGDRYLNWSPELALLEVGIFSGEIVFRPIHHREGMPLKQGQLIQFVAAKEGDEIAYDKLLHGKSVPQGKIIGPEPLTDEVREKITQEKLKKEHHLKKKVEIQKRKKAENDPVWICKKPRGKFNDCQWACEGNPKAEKKICRLELANVQCVRYRCNAGGQWRDPLPVLKDEGQLRCRIQPQVDKCID